METKQIWANVAVKDLERTTKFYTALGFKSNGSSKALTSFFFGDNNFVMHFFLKEELQKIMPNISDSSIGNEVIFSLSAKSKAEVDQWAQEVKKAGGSIFFEPSDFDKGYTCGFSDPDGHQFNVLYWPGM